MEDWQGHLADVLTGEADGFDPRCVMCRAICRAIGIDPADAHLLVPPQSERKRKELLEGIRSLAPHEVRCTCDQAGNANIHQHGDDCPRKDVDNLLKPFEEGRA